MSNTYRPSYAIAPPIEPMLARLTAELPMEGPFLSEPKWDGFRAIVFHGALLAALPKGCVLDGEIVIATPRGLWCRCFLPAGPVLFFTLPATY